ncbi:MAG TPA: cytochrome c biogenesis protein CcsA [Candidatus Angelobacter sp.]|jgi:heme exporter protein C|nr:cytochrome c biogenesis protein CcsA [Candidatus Angelobacter sp.]
MKSKLFYLLLVINAGMLAWGTYAGLKLAPTEQTMGDVQRIFYCHVPSAVTGFTLFFLNFIASIVYLWKRSPAADAFALSSAEVGVVFCTVVLVTGPIWARYAWGTWWVWDMRLTTTLILWLLYVSYLVLRKSSEAGSTSVLAAALAIFAFLDVPIVYMANRWFRTNHPQPMIGTPNLDPRMQNILFFNMFAFLIFGLLIAWFRYDLERIAQKLATLHIQRAARGVMAALIPAMFLQVPTHSGWAPNTYLVTAYVACWSIYVIYLLTLLAKLKGLQREQLEIGR